jgi:hypothetical protein
MVLPQTIGALAAFLVLVAPGIVFELRRERRRGGHRESAFREASRVALGSLVFSLVAIWMLIGLETVGAPFADVVAWSTGGWGYARQNLFLVVWTIIAELALACGAAAAADLLVGRYGREEATVRKLSAWTETLRRDCPPKAVPWVHVCLEDGSSFFGALRSYTVGDVVADREIVLDGRGLTYVGRPTDGGDEFENEPIGETWERVIIAAARINYLRVVYLHQETGERVLYKAKRRRVSEVEAQVEPA